MRDRFTTIISSKQRKKITLTKKNLSSSKQSDIFVQALSVQYGRKIRDEDAIKKSRAEEEFVIDQAIDSDTKDLIYDLIKKEYLRRIYAPNNYPDIRFKVSDIASDVEQATKITPGRLYPLLKDMAVENWNFTLSSENEDGTKTDDPLIEFVPISDFEVYDALEEYRPDKLQVIRRIMQTWFERNVRYKGKRLEKLPPETYSNEEEEASRSFLSKWFMETMQYCAKYYNDRESIRNLYNRIDKLRKSVSLLTKKDKKGSQNDTETEPDSEMSESNETE
jgi:hypothetical protein